MNPPRCRLTSAGILLAAGLILFSPFSRGAETAPVCKKEIPQITFKNLSPPYGDDIVSRVPPAGLYHHVGELKIINRKGATQDTITTMGEGRASCREQPDSSGGLKENKASDLSQLIPDAILDYVPLLYVIFLWNQLIENQN
jgi:hypothetical protein